MRMGSRGGSPLPRRKEALWLRQRLAAGACEKISPAVSVLTEAEPRQPTSACAGIPLADNYAAWR